MENVLDQIMQADGAALSDILLTVRKRYGELYPDWEFSLLSVPKVDNRNEIIENTIHLLKKQKI